MSFSFTDTLAETLYGVYATASAKTAVGLMFGKIAVRLYESAWVLLRDIEQPMQVRKDRANPALFHAGPYNYDIDGRPFFVAEATPDIVEILSMSAARERGLSTQYNWSLSDKF